MGTEYLFMARARVGNFTNWKLWQDRGVQIPLREINNYINKNKLMNDEIICNIWDDDFEQKYLKRQ